MYRRPLMEIGEAIPGTAQLEAIARASGTPEALSQRTNWPLTASTAVHANLRSGQLASGTRSWGKPREAAKLATKASSPTTEVCKAHAPISLHTSSFGRTPAYASIIFATNCERSGGFDMDALGGGAGSPFPVNGSVNGSTSAAGVRPSAICAPTPDPADVPTTKSAR